jgi:hydrogenase maturation protease
MTRARGPLVIGLGSPDRGDDAVGPMVGRAVATHLPTVRVIDREDPTALLDVWEGHDPVVVIDAVCSGSPPGTVHRLETGQAGPPLPERTRAHLARGGTHAIGLGEMVEIGRALGQLPDRLVVVGVEAESFDHGAPLSTAVAAALPAAVARVREALTGAAAVSESR